MKTKKIGRRRFLVTAQTENTHVAALGRGKLFRGCSYTVIVSHNNEKMPLVRGRFDDVIITLKGNEKAEVAIPVVRKAAELISDPERSLRNVFNDLELLCIFILKDGPLSLADITDITRQRKESVSAILRGLEMLGVVCQCRRRGDPQEGYALTKKGKKKALLFADERDHKLEHIAKLKQEEGKE